MLRYVFLLVIAVEAVVQHAASNQLFKLPCIGEWVVIMNRYNGELSFNRSWSEYKTGFGKLDSEFWIGNDNINALSVAGYSVLRIEIQAKSSGKWYYSQYDGFGLSSESDGYAIQLGTYKGNVSDCFKNGRDAFRNIDGYKFSTPDVDNDSKRDISCAGAYAAGWWFNECWCGCPTCVYGSADFAFDTLTEADQKLSAARMMVKKN